MSPFEEFLNSLMTLNPWVLVKMAYLAFIILYVAFAVIVVSQVKLMVKVLNGNFDLPLKILAVFHLALSVLIFLVGLSVL